MSGVQFWVPEVEKSKYNGENYYRYRNVLVKKKIKMLYMSRFQNDKL